MSKIGITKLAAALLVAFLAGAAIVHFRVPQMLRDATHSRADTWESRPLYRHRVDYFERAATTADITMVGDSLTELAEWSELLPNFRIANRGISGDTSSGVENRLPAILATNASIYGIMVGVNDLRLLQASPPQVFERYARLIDRISDEAHVFVFSTLFVSDGSAAELNPKIAALNAMLAGKCAEGRCTFTDLNTDLSPQGRLSAAYSLDGLHLNGAGYLVWARRLHEATALLSPR